MRKWVVLILFVTLFASVFSVSKASFEGVLLQQFPQQSILYASLAKDKKLAVLSKIIILPRETFDQKEAAAMINRLGNLPVTLLNTIYQKRISVKLFQGKLTDNPTARHLKGKIPRGYQNKETWDAVPGIGGSKTVLVKIGHSQKGMGHGSVNLELHELAHSIDRFILEEVKTNPSFIDIWKKESNVLFPNRNYFLHFPEEYFAESFALFYLNADTQKLLKATAPETYEFIRNLH